MANFTFTINEIENREASKISFDVPNDLDIWEYKRICIRMAGAMGYADESIKKAFDNEYGDSKNDILELKQFLQNQFTSSIL